MEAKASKIAEAVPAHLTAAEERALRRACERDLKRVLVDLRRRFAPTTCALCIDRVLAVSVAMVFIPQAINVVRTIDDLEALVSVLVKGLAQEFQATRAAEAQAVTTTPPAAVH